MDSQRSETAIEQDESSEDENVSRNRRDALTKLAYGSPAIAALLLSKSAAAQFSPPPRPPG